MVIMAEYFIQAALGIGQCGILAPDFHQSCRDLVGTPALTFTRQALAQSQRNGDGQAFAGEVGEFSRQLVGLVILDAEMHGLRHGRNIGMISAGA